MPDTPDIRRQIAAFLAGDLGDADAAAVQDRIDSEPWVAAVADAQADLMMRLGAVDNVTPLPGFSQRLRAGLSEEIGRDLPTPSASTLQAAGAAAADGWARSAPAGRHDAQRPGRSRSDRRTRGLVGAVAAIVVLFIGSSAVLLSGFGSSNDSASDSVVDSAVRSADDGAAAFDSAEDDSALSAEAPAPSSTATSDGGAELAQEEAQDAAADDAGADLASGSGAEALIEADEDAPSLIELGVLPDPAVDPDLLRQRIAGDPAVGRVTGLRENDAGDPAIRYRDLILDASAFTDSGALPGSCLDQVLATAEGVVVPAVVADFTVDGQSSLAYGLVGLVDDGTLGRVSIHVVEPATCDTLLVIP